MRAHSATDNRDRLKAKHRSLEDVLDDHVGSHQKVLRCTALNFDHSRKIVEVNECSPSKVEGNDLVTCLGYCLSTLFLACRCWRDPQAQSAAEKVGRV